VKSGHRPVFAFVEFEDARDAEDAVKSRDGYNYDGYRIRVEFTRGVGPRGPGGRPVGGGGGDRDDDRDRDRGRNGGGRGGPPPYRGGGGGGRDRPSGGGGGSGRKGSGYRVMVSGLPTSGSWQDLKDHMRAAGDVCYSDVYRDGTGVVEYERLEDMKYAIKKLDDTKFRSHEGETSYIRIKESRSSRSRSPVGRRGSPSYSPRRSRSRSAAGSRGRSASRSP